MDFRANYLLNGNLKEPQNVDWKFGTAECCIHYKQYIASNSILTQCSRDYVAYGVVKCLEKFISNNINSTHRKLIADVKENL